MKKNSTLIYFVPQGKYPQASIELLKKVSKNNEGIYVSVSQPVKKIIPKLKEHKIKVNNILFVDATSNNGDFENCVYVKSPNSLAPLSLAVTKGLNTGKLDFLFFDSLSALLESHDKKLVIKFSQYLINKVTSMGVKSVFIILKNKDSQYLEVLSSIADNA